MCTSDVVPEAHLRGGTCVILFFMETLASEVTDSRYTVGKSMHRIAGCLRLFRLHEMDSMLSSSSFEVGSTCDGR
jgi:hypothetical protein